MTITDKEHLEVNIWLAEQAGECNHVWGIHSWTRKGISGHSTPTVEKEWRCKCGKTAFISEQSPLSVTPRSRDLGAMVDLADKLMFSYDLSTGGNFVRVVNIVKDIRISVFFKDHPSPSEAAAWCLVQALREVKK